MPKIALAVPPTCPTTAVTPALARSSSIGHGTPHPCWQPIRQGSASVCRVRKGSEASGPGTWLLRA